MAVQIATGAASTNVCSVLWDNALARGAVTSTATAADYPAENAVKDPATWNSWRPTTAGGYITIDMGVATAFDTFAIAAHNLATSGAELRINGSNDGTTFTSIVTYNAATNEDAVFVFPAVSYRYVRIVLINAPANIGVVFGGQKLSFAHSPIVPYVPLYHGKNYDKTFNSSIGGQLLSNRVMALAAETSVDLWCLGRNWTDTAMRGFEEHYNQGGTFFYMSNPLAYPRDMGYCTALGNDSSVSVTYEEGPDLATVSFDIKAYMSV